MMRRIRVYLAIAVLAMTAWAGVAAMSSTGGVVAGGGIWCCHPN
jgi:hypothetical protein